MPRIMRCASLREPAARQNVHVARQWVRAVVANHQTIAVDPPLWPWGKG